MALRGANFDPLALRSALASVPSAAWSLPSTFAATAVHHGYRRVVLVDSGRWLPEADPFAFVLDVFEPVHAAWLSWIDPGGFIVSHRDAGPWRERWQVPIAAAGSFTMGEAFVPTDGSAFAVRHWEWHSVTNDSDRPRIHLVIDRDVIFDRPAEPFAIQGDAHG